MNHQPKRVIMVTGYTWGMVSQEEADDTLQTMVRFFERATVRDYETGTDVLAATVEVVKRGDLEDRLGMYPNPDVVVFPSRGAVEVAKELAARRHGPKVVVLTGMIPAGEVLFVDKGWGPQTISDVIIGR